MTKIRLAKKEDMKAVLALITELAVYEKEPHAVRISEKTLFSTVFLSPGSIVLLPNIL